jgi:5-formyltetrahydrofolate cyclo-ligase
VQTQQIITDSLKSGKTIFVPVTPLDGRSLIFSELHDFSELKKRTHLGILEPEPQNLHPKPLTDADLILVPLVAWDERGHRLGHGKGYFDTALATVPEKLSIGLAFEAQRVDRLPVEPHDVRLKMIVTEKRVLRFSN